MTLHDLKCWPETFVHLLSGTKTFEVRKNDRNYQIGDELLLREWEPRTETYSGRSVRRRVTFVAHGMGNVGVIGPLRGLSLGYVVLALTDSLDEGQTDVACALDGAESGTDCSSASAAPGR